MKKVTAKQIENANQSLDREPAYDRWFARPLSLYLTKPFLSLEPTVMCFTMLMIGLFSLPFFIKGTYSSIIFGALILHLYLVFDNIDGNIARAMNKKTLRGKYLDFVPNITTNPLVFIALGYGLFTSFGDINYLLLGISAGFFHLAKEPARLFRYLMLDELNLNKKQKTRTSNQKQSPLFQKINKLITTFFDYPYFAVILLIFALFNSSKYLIIFYGLTMPSIFILRVAYEFYYWKKRDKR
tara:strand:+ start:25893 stop:26615 length:723 start_codon:yes stop_codon:yes gene_type:complete